MSMMAPPSNALDTSTNVPLRTSFIMGEPPRSTSDTMVKGSISIRQIRTTRPDVSMPMGWPAMVPSAD